MSRRAWAICVVLLMLVAGCGAKPYHFYAVPGAGASQFAVGATVHVDAGTVQILVVKKYRWPAKAKPKSNDRAGLAVKVRITPHNVGDSGLPAFDSYDQDGVPANIEQDTKVGPDGAPSVWALADHWNAGKPYDAWVLYVYRPQTTRTLTMRVNGASRDGRILLVNNPEADSLKIPRTSSIGVGSQVTADRYTVTLLAIKDPATEIHGMAKSTTGARLVALKLKVTNHGSTSAPQFNLLSRGRQLNPAVGATSVFDDPEQPWVAAESRIGWIAFDVSLRTEPQVLRLVAKREPGAKRRYASAWIDLRHISLVGATAHGRRPTAPK